MDETAFKKRTKALANRVIKVVAALPNNRVADVIARQLVRSGTSVGANYRAACRSRSQAEMISKLANVEEEADETVYWLELLTENNLMSHRRLSSLIAEANEILSMTVASIRTLKTRSSAKSIQNPKSKIQNGQN